MIRTHKIRFKRLSNKQRAVLWRACGARRFCYNQAKATNEAYYKEHGKGLSKFSLRNAVVKTKQDNSWLYDFPKSLLEEAVFDFYVNLKAFFRKERGYPAWLSRKDGYGSFTLSNTQFSIGGTTLSVAKLGAFRLTEALRFEGKIQNATISLRGKHAYVSVSVETQTVPLDHTGVVAGVDVNIRNIVTSEGESFDAPLPLRRVQAQLKQRQRALSRTRKGSKNRARARLRLAYTHEKVARIRNDFLHKVSHALVREYSVIGVETLNVSGMMRNHHLARSITDASFATLLSQLSYKSELYGRQCVKVGQFFPSSKQCSSCKAVKPKLSLSERTFVCDACGTSIDRDLNAAINIRDEAIRLLTSGYGAVMRVERMSDAVPPGTSATLNETRTVHCSS